MMMTMRSRGDDARASCARAAARGAAYVVYNTYSGKRVVPTAYVRMASTLMLATLCLHLSRTAYSSATRAEQLDLSAAMCVDQSRRTTAGAFVHVFILYD